MRTGGWLKRLRGVFWRRHAAGYVAYLNGKALEDLAKGDLKRARYDLKTARRISREWLGGEDLTALQAMRDSVVERFRAGDPERARELGGRWFAVVADQAESGLPYPGAFADLERILAAAQTPGEREPDLSWIHRGLARWIETAEGSPEAEPVLCGAVAIWERYLGAPGEIYLDALDRLAEALALANRFEEALAFAERAVEATRAAPQPDPIPLSRRVIDLGLLRFMAGGDFAAAEEALAEADRLLAQAAAQRSLGSSKAERSERVGRFVGGTLKELLGLYRSGFSARNLRPLLKLISRSEAPDPLVAAEFRLWMARVLLLTNLGRDDEVLGEIDIDSWEPLFADLFDGEPDLETTDLADEKTVVDLVDLLDPVRPAYDRLLQDLAEGRGPLLPEAAEAKVRAAVTRRVEALGEHCSETAFARYKLAQLLARRGGKGDLEEAEGLLRRAVADWRQLPNAGPFYLSLALSSLAALLAETGHGEEAWDLLMEVAAGEDRLISNAFSFTSEEQRFEFLASLEHTYVRSLALARSVAVSPARVREAYSLVLRRKGAVGRSRRLQWQSALAVQPPEVAELEEVQRRISERLLSAETDEDGGGLAPLRERRDQLEGTLARNASVDVLLRELGPVDVGDLARALPEGSALLDFLVAETRVEGLFELQLGWDHHLLAFFLPAGDPEGLRFLDLGEAGDFARAIQEVRGGSVQGPARDLAPALPATASPGEEAETWLAAHLVRPFLDLAGGRKRLLVSPDGDLNLLPFEILPDGKGGQLVDHLSFSYVASGRDVLRFGAPLDDATAAVVVAAPDYDLDCPPGLAAAGPFAPLEHAPGEGEEVARLLGVEPWMGADATEERLRAVRSPHLLHLATHGFLFEEPDGPDREPMVRSGLALAGANAAFLGGIGDDTGDGLLTAAEVASLDLRDTELVVLSACKTGLGALKDGEGVQGLRRAFALAGARTLVISLWEVPDEETRELMVAFFEGLKDGLGRAEALLRAQRHLKAGGAPPLAWGAFVCQGDPGPLLLPAGWTPTGPPAPGRAA